MLTLSSHAAFLAALATAHDVTCEAYTLSRPLADALTAAAAHGARVRVRVEGAPLGANDWQLAKINRHRVTELRAHGVDASLADGRDGVVHAKAAVIDGVAWLDDRNFPKRGPDVIVRDDDPVDAAAIANAMGGGTAADGRVALDKAAALALEARALTTNAPTTLDVSTESFGDGPIEGLLREALDRGAHVRLLLASHELREGTSYEARALALLAGAEIRVRSEVDKLAVTPSCAWVGSANATFSGSDAQRDWGIVTDQPAAVAELEAHFVDAWNTAHTYAPQSTLIA